MLLKMMLSRVCLQNYCWKTLCKKPILRLTMVVNQGHAIYHGSYSWFTTILWMLFMVVIHGQPW